MIYGVVVDQTSYMLKLLVLNTPFQDLTPDLPGS